MKKTKIRLFLEIVRSAYLGEPFNYGGTTFNLKPTIVSSYDFIKEIHKPQTEYERLLRALPEDFKRTARSELYRKTGGWVGQKRGNFEVRRVKDAGEEVLLPVLSERTVGIDSSGIGNKSTVFAFCFFSDPEAGYDYLEGHLSLPKTRNHVEIKWSKLAPKYKKKVSKHYDQILNFFCEAVLVIETDAFISRVEKAANIFKKLIEGCFSGYQYKKKIRLGLREKFFKLVNNTPIHSDPDFRPLTREKMVRLLVKTLAKRKNQFLEYKPVHIPLESHESHPIQLADVIVGYVRSQIQRGGMPRAFSPLYFDQRKIKNPKYAKIHYWFKE